MNSSIVSDPAVYVRIDTPEQAGLFAVEHYPVIEVNAAPESEVWRKSGAVNDQHVAKMRLKLDGRNILELNTFHDPMSNWEEWSPAYYAETPEKAAVLALKDGMKIAEALATLIEELRRNTQEDAWLVFWEQGNHNLAWKYKPLKMQGN